MGRDSNPRCLSAHTLSRRAQSTTLSPIQALDRYLTISILSPRMTCRGSCQLLVPARCSRRPAGDALRMPNTSPRRFPQGSGYRLSAAQLQSPEQFVERQLDTDVKLTEIRVLSADR